MELIVGYSWVRSLLLLSLPSSFFGFVNGGAEGDIVAAYQTG